MIAAHSVLGVMSRTPSARSGSCRGSAVRRQFLASAAVPSAMTARCGRHCSSTLWPKQRAERQNGPCWFAPGAREGGVVFAAAAFSSTAFPRPEEVRRCSAIHLGDDAGRIPRGSGRRTGAPACTLVTGSSRLFACNARAVARSAPAPGPLRLVVDCATRMAIVHEQAAHDCRRSAQRHVRQQLGSWYGFVDTRTVSVNCPNPASVDGSRRPVRRRRSPSEPERRAAPPGPTTIRMARHQVGHGGPAGPAPGSSAGPCRLGSGRADPGALQLLRTHTGLVDPCAAAAGPGGASSWRRGAESGSALTCPSRSAIAVHDRQRVHTDAPTPCSVRGVGAAAELAARVQPGHHRR